MHTKFSEHEFLFTHCNLPLQISIQESLIVLGSVMALFDTALLAGRSPNTLLSEIIIETQNKNDAASYNDKALNSHTL